MGTMSARVSVGQRSSASGTCAAKSTTNSLWLAAKSISALLTTTQVATLSLELIHGDSRELGSSVVRSFVLMNFMDRDGCVNDGWLNRLLLHDWLDVLVHMVVDVLTCDRGMSGLRVLNVADGAGVLELGFLGGKTVIDVVVVAVLDVTVLYTGHVVAVLFGKDLLVLYGLDRSVVMILMNFTVNSGLKVLVLGTSDILVGD